MWLLEASGDVFAGRRLWLRPGRTYLFGRTDSEPGQIAILHKTVSRKHLKIAVDSVEDGDAHDPDKRTRVTITDLGTKSGTTIDGQTIKAADHAVDSDLTTFRVGRFEEDFRLVWHPIVFAFAFSSKELQANPMSKLRQAFGQLDVKLLAQYDSETTTHLVTKKRNTSKGLQALLDAKYIVATGFLDAIAHAAEPDANRQSASALEADFDGNWPSELEHLPPRSNEATDCPVAEYSPNPARRDIFYGYTYVFYDRTQFDNLLPAITSGKGKALVHEVVPGKTPVDDLVRFVKVVAGEKGLGRFEDGSEGKGVVVVRFTPAKGDQVDWYRVFFESVSLQLDHRLIEQGEFLEAILRNEPGILRRPLEVEEDGGGASAPTTYTQNVPDQEEVAPPSQQEVDVQPPVRRGRGRRPIRKKFTGFDDVDEDMDAEVAIKSMPASDAPQEPSPDPALPDSESQSQGLFVRQEAPPQQPTSVPAGRAAQKRVGSPLDEEPDNLLDAMAPTAMARKRRRIAAGEDAKPTTPTEDAQPPDSSPEAPKRKTKPAVDALGFTMQKRRDKEEAQRRAETEVSSTKVAEMTDSDLAAIRSLALVEDMELVPRRNWPLQKDDEHAVGDGRWDERWNGRKNFKWFRRQGQSQGRRPRRDIIDVAPTRKKDFGVGDSHWLEGSFSSMTARNTNTSEVVIPHTDSSAHVPTNGRRATTRRREAASFDEEEDDVSAGSWGAPAHQTRSHGAVSAVVSHDSMVIEQTPEPQPPDTAASPPGSTQRELETDFAPDPDPYEPRRLRGGQRTAISPMAVRSTRPTRGASQTQTQTQASPPAVPRATRAGVKRGAPVAGREQPAKRRKASASASASAVIEVSDSDEGGGGQGGRDDEDSDDGAASDGSMKFVFGKR